ncbi:ankyrin repeat domain-containing protein [Gramella sp. GC03-9]|uniref:Ankyrin repeat domain-containing protein n=1 Tax=Christiangramia oceanisediminis TaxID=2920386 RepID=A0A9X2KV56_9FLAO|nr:ankyrin repeat domain-containing protein [Gramella oceanisediminis]MCP9198837.1 ankyrin repeat domain-containing protein [Gramella oceanisediminis]
MKKRLSLLVFLLVTISTFSQELFEAVDNEDYEKVKSLLEQENDPLEYSSTGLFPLWRATADNNYEISKLLIAHGADVNQEINVPPSTSTPIEIPCQEGYFEIVKLLVENGADVNHVGFRGFTPIRIAAMNDNLEIVKFLAASGANIDARAMDGATPLEHAASKGHFEVVKFLVQQGANVNNVDEEGDFPIGEAAKYGYLDIIDLLIENNADLNLKNADNKNAYTLAKERGQRKAAKLIKEYM